MKKVLVLDACQRSGLAVTRSLGARGLEVYTADETHTALAGRSRYSKTYYRYPSPRTEPQAFTRAIASLCRSQNIDLLMPIHERGTEDPDIFDVIEGTDGDILAITVRGLGSCGTLTFHENRVTFDRPASDAARGRLGHPCRAGCRGGFPPRSAECTA